MPILQRSSLSSESFIYLGVFFDSLRDATAAWDYREGIGWKALGAVKGELRGAPFLPLARMSGVHQRAPLPSSRQSAFWEQGREERGRFARRS